MTDKGGLWYEQPFTIGVSNVNEPPVLSNIEKPVTPGAAMNFAPADFAGAFQDPDGDTLGPVKIVSLPASGSLTLSGAAVKKGQNIAVDLLSDLVYAPRQGFTGTDKFTWNASDGLLSCPYRKFRPP